MKAIPRMVAMTIPAIAVEGRGVAWVAVDVEDAADAEPLATVLLR